MKRLALLIAIVSALTAAYVAPASAAGKSCYTSSNGSVRAGHVSCAIALRVLHRAAEHYTSQGLGSFSVHVNGTWRCESTRVKSPASIATACQRGSAIVVIVAQP